MRSSSSIFPGLIFFTVFYLGYGSIIHYNFWLLSCLGFASMQRGVCSFEPQHFCDHLLLRGLRWAKEGRWGGYLSRGAVIAVPGQRLNGLHWFDAGSHFRLRKENIHRQWALWGWSSESNRLSPVHSIVPIWQNYALNSFTAISWIHSFLPWNKWSIYFSCNVKRLLTKNFVDIWEQKKFEERMKERAVEAREAGLKQAIQIKK